MVKPVSTQNTKKISWAWWHVPVIPATQEAEAGELPEHIVYIFNIISTISLYMNIFMHP